MVEQAFHVEQTIRGYLPNTLERYLRLPPVYARMHPVKDGKTAEVLLVEHLTDRQAGWLAGYLDMYLAGFAE